MTTAGTTDNSLEPSDMGTLETVAGEKGWVPQDQWEGDPDQWRPAKEFIERGELMDRISSQSRQLNKYTSEVQELKQGLKQLAEHNKKVAELEYEKAINSLKRQKSEAFDMGDHDSVVDIDEQISDLKSSKKATEEAETKAQSPKPQSKQLPPEFVSWVEQNTWYRDDVALRGAADAVARQFINENPGVENSPNIVLAHVTSEIRKDFSERMGVQKHRPSATADPSNRGSSTVTRGTKKHSVNSLSQEQRVIAKRFAATGVMTEQDYVNQLAELGELG